jgi:2-methylcitrate dehydratase PrpD
MTERGPSSSTSGAWPPASPADALNTVAHFALDTAPDDLPHAAIEAARWFLRDLVATAASGSGTAMATISRTVAARSGPRPDGARVLFGGSDRVDPALAAFAGAATIDSFDAHDGHVLTKGHTGVAVLPAALAAIDRSRQLVSGRALLTTLAVGYEIGIRAGIASHRTAADYFTSGSWNCIAAAAAVGRHSDLDVDRLGQAFGIAEFSSPRGLMMRCIDEPTMVKDGSCWGAQIGVQSVDLAQLGFTASRPETIALGSVADVWADLGSLWRIHEQYIKAYPVCRWAQPAIEAARWCAGQPGFALDQVDRITVATFAAGCRLAHAHPRSTEEAQYSLPFPVAAMLVHGDLGPRRIDGEGLADPQVLGLAARIELVEDPTANARFPHERWASVEVTLADGRTIASPSMRARGDAEEPLSPAELDVKWDELVPASLGAGRARHLKSLVDGVADLDDIEPLLEAIYRPT